MNKLTIAISSRALFDLSESHKIFEKKGVEAYAKFQYDNEDVPLDAGVGFSLIQKILKLSSEKMPIDVVLLSSNSAETGLRIFNSIEHHKLNIIRAVFTRGKPTAPYLKPFDVDLFLSADDNDVKSALKAGYAAASIVASNHTPNKEQQLRIAFDGDAVIFSDESEKIYQEKGLKAFEENEKKLANIMLKPGCFEPFLKVVQKLQNSFPESNNPIRTALVTARSAPSHKRVIHTMRKRGIRLDETFFLGGLDKGKFLAEFGADIFFDDQAKHCQSANDCGIASGHVLDGIKNK
jgi:5'-nucleotidase